MIGRGADDLVGAGDDDPVVAHDHAARLGVTVGAGDAEADHRRAHLVLHRGDGLVVREDRAAGTFGVTFTRSITLLGIHGQVAGEREHAAAEHGADEAGDQGDRPHRGPPARLGGRGQRGREPSAAERRDLRRVTPQAVVGRAAVGRDRRRRPRRRRPWTWLRNGSGGPRREVRGQPKVARWIALRLPPPRAGDDWVALSADPLPVAAAGEWVVRPDCGATVVFTGTARDHAEGRPGVHRLEYEAYEEPALARLRAIAAEVRRRWPVIGRVALLHRTGVVELGDAAVVVAVSAPHRGEAFDAARYAIDELKRTVPIWKRESWDGGESWGLEAQHLTEVGRGLMQAVLFLAIVVVVCAIGGLVLYVQHRQPNTMESGMDSFRREMDALAPPPDEPAPKLRMAKRPTPRSQRPPSGRAR